MNIDDLKQTVNTRGWEVVVSILEEEIAQEKKDIDTKGRRFEDVAIDTISQKQAARIVKRALSKINRLTTNPEENKIVYR